MYPGYQHYGYETISVTNPVAFVAQHQDTQPGLESQMQPRPISNNPDYHGSGKLREKAAVISGGDSGIGRAVALAFAKEGAHIAILYYTEQDDAEETKSMIEAAGRRCLLLQGNIKDPEFCSSAVAKAIQEFSKIDVLVNNAGVQFPQNSILDITPEQLENTFQTNLFSMFYLTKAALPAMKCGASIINTASVTAYEGEKRLIDYSATKGAVVSFTRSLSLSLADLGIRVNAVAPGPVWTPLIPSSFQAEEVASFGIKVPMKRAAQPFELAPAYVYLASDDSGYMSGQVLHVNGGTITGS